MKTIQKSEYGNYEHFKGDIWISEQKDKELQGMNIALLKESGEFKVLAYVIRKGNMIEYNTGKRLSIEEAVCDTIKSYGYGNDEYCKKVLGY